MTNQTDSEGGLEPSAALTDAINGWNARAGVAQEGIARALDGVRARLDGFERVLEARKALHPERLAVDAAALEEQLPALERELARYQVELQTLEAQLTRTGEAGKRVATGILALYGETITDFLRQDSDQRREEADADEARAEDAELAEAAEAEAAIAPELIRLRAALAASQEREAEHVADLAVVQAELEDLRGRMSEERPADDAPRGEAVQEGAEADFGVKRLRSEAAASREVAGGLFQHLEQNQRFDRIRRVARTPDGRKQPMGVILVEAGLITPRQLEEALEEQRSAWNRHLGHILVELNFASEEAIAQALAAQIDLPFLTLRNENIQEQAVALISGHLARHHSCIPFRCDQSTVEVAMANPLDLIALEDVQLAASRHVSPHVATAREIKAAIRHHYPSL